MSRRWLAVLAIVGGSLAWANGPALAQTVCTPVQTADGWGCAETSPGSPPSDGDDSDGGGSDCTWTPYLPTLPEADHNSGIYDDANFDGTYDGSTSPLVRIWPDGRRDEAYYVVCDGRSGGVVWTDSTITPRELAERAFARVIVPTPQVAISPAPEFGTYVNLGLWLAIEEVPTLRDSETEGSVSIELIGEYQGMTWTFGNGDTVTCDDFGEQYEEGSQTLEEGPCGYTYTAEPTGETYTVTVTTTWSFRFTSNSDSGPLGDLPGEVDFQYQVSEIQTVGVDPNG